MESLPTDQAAAIALYEKVESLFAQRAVPTRIDRYDSEEQIYHLRPAELEAAAQAVMALGESKPDAISVEKHVDLPTFNKRGVMSHPGEEWVGVDIANRGISNVYFIGRLPGCSFSMRKEITSPMSGPIKPFAEAQPLTADYIIDQAMARIFAVDSALAEEEAAGLNMVSSEEQAMLLQILESIEN